MATPAELLRGVREFARMPYAFPGGYPKVLVMDDGECLCAKCARSNYRLISTDTRSGSRAGWRAAGVDIHWEGAPIICAHCAAEIESAYGEVDENAQ